MGRGSRGPEATNRNMNNSIKITGFVNLLRLGGAK
jgi:hypothetical protein